MLYSLTNISGLSLERLKTLCAVAKSGSITKAAEGDPTKQSQFSRQIRELEESFEIKLVRKEGRSAVLTDAAERLVSISNEFFQSLAEFQSREGQKPLLINMAANQYILDTLIYPQLAEFKKAFGGCHMSLFNMRSSEIIGGVENSTIEFGIVSQRTLPQGIHSHSAYQAKFCLAVPQKFNIKIQKLRDLQKLKPLSLGTLNSSGKYMAGVNQIMQKYSDSFQPSLSVGSFSTLAACVKDGVCAGFLPIEMIQGLKSVQMIESKEIETLDRKYLMIWKSKLESLNLRTDDVRKWWLGNCN
jgi:DNA-binding transcriptional LysR family regulator